MFDTSSSLQAFCLCLSALILSLSVLSIFFCSATGVCIQALEEGTDIIHFPDNMIFDAFSSKIWENINVKKIDENILRYSIKKKGRIFKITHEKNKFNKYLIKKIRNNVISK